MSIKEFLRFLDIISIHYYIMYYQLLNESKMKVVYSTSYSQNVHRYRERSVLKVLVQPKMANAFQNIMKDVLKDTIV